MKALTRAFWLLVQAAFGCAVLPWFIATRRGRPLVFTHHQDRDAAGRDRQLGPLLDRLGARRIEVAFVPGNATATCRRLRPGAGLVIPYATLRMIARVLTPLSRDPSTRAARWLLAVLRPSVVFLIDESGSGQPFVRAARTLGIRTAGIQHGDFAPGNPQYDGAAARGLDAADVLCVWSAWFQARLLAVSTIYTHANTCVTGRLRDPTPPTSSTRDPDALRVLVVGEADPAFAAAIEPYLAAMRAAPDVGIVVHPHPATSAGGRDLATALLWSDVVVGRRSSALLEALWHARPSVIVGADSAAHEFVVAGLATACAQPTAVAATCRTIRSTSAAGVVAARARVWGGAPADPVRAIVAAAEAADR